MSIRSEADTTLKFLSHLSTQVTQKVLFNEIKGSCAFWKIDMFLSPQLVYGILATMWLVWVETNFSSSIITLLEQRCMSQVIYCNANAYFSFNILCCPSKIRCYFREWSVTVVQVYPSYLLLEALFLEKTLQDNTGFLSIRNYKWHSNSSMWKRRKSNYVNVYMRFTVALIMLVFAQIQRLTCSSKRYRCRFACMIWNKRIHHSCV